MPKHPPKPAATKPEESFHCNACVVDIPASHVKTCAECGSKSCPICTRRFGVAPAELEKPATTPAKCKCGRQ